MRLNVEPEMNIKNAKTHLDVLEDDAWKFYKIPIWKSICVVDRIIWILYSFHCRTQISQLHIFQPSTIRVMSFSTADRI